MGDLNKPMNQNKENNNAVDLTKKQLRGSSLLLAGKIISVGLNFVAQVLLVRFLTQSDYGAWGYALAMVAFFQAFATLGLKRSITRFIPIYHEKNEYEKVVGTIVLVLGTILVTGLLIIGALFTAPDMISNLIGDDNQPLYLLLILIFLVPVEAIDGMLIGLFASFANPRTIFFRKHIIGPVLKLTVVLLLIIFKSTVLFMAYGYLMASALGVMIYSVILVRLLKKQGLLNNLSLKSIKIPAKEIFAFTIPLLTSDLVLVIMHSADTMILGYFHDTTQVALYRVILPAAHFNKIVMTSFALLYTPLAARLFAKKNYEGINDLYWKTALWMSILSFPIFTLTFSMANPLTTMLYGTRYEQSWLFLNMMSFAYYFNCTLGFNGLTLKVLGKVRYVMMINIGAAILNVVLDIILIPKFGALGASVATAGAMIIHNIFKQAGLRLASGINLFNRQYLSFYVVIFSGAVLLLAFQMLTSANIFIGVILAGMMSLAVFYFYRDKLQVEDTFPELLRIPLMRAVFSASGSTR